MAGYKKRKFSHAEKYAIWHCHGRRCWLCEEPLEIPAMSVDHFLPESLLNDRSKLADTLYDHGLADGFDINGFENLLPAHRWCNERKGSHTFGFVPANLVVLNRLNSRAGEVTSLVRKIESDEGKSRLFGIIMSGLERGTLSRSDLDSVISMVKEEPFSDFERSEILLLDNGYWLFRSDIVLEGYCKCEQNTCAGTDKKVYCYFGPDQSDWVVKKGLYIRCYDEITECPRCGRQHKRGHIGSGRFSCGSPFRDQVNQCD